MNGGSSSVLHPCWLPMPSQQRAGSGEPCLCSWWGCSPGALAAGVGLVRTPPACGFASACDRHTYLLVSVTWDTALKATETLGVFGLKILRNLMVSHPQFDSFLHPPEQFLTLKFLTSSNPLGCFQFLLEKLGWLLLLLDCWLKLASCYGFLFWM